MQAISNLGLVEVTPDVSKTQGKSNETPQGKAFGDVFAKGETSDHPSPDQQIPTQAKPEETPKVEMVDPLRVLDPEKLALTVVTPNLGDKVVADPAKIVAQDPLVKTPLPEVSKPNEGRHPLPLDTPIAAPRPGDPLDPAVNPRVLTPEAVKVGETPIPTKTVVQDGRIPAPDLPQPTAKVAEDRPQTTPAPVAPAKSATPVAPSPVIADAPAQVEVQVARPVERPKTDGVIPSTKPTETVALPRSTGQPVAPDTVKPTAEPETPPVETGRSQPVSRPAAPDGLPTEPTVQRPLTPVKPVTAPVETTHVSRPMFPEGVSEKDFKAPIDRLDPALTGGRWSTAQTSDLDVQIRPFGPQQTEGRAPTAPVVIKAPAAPVLGNDAEQILVAPPNKGPTATVASVQTQASPVQPGQYQLQQVAPRAVKRDAELEPRDIRAPRVAEVSTTTPAPATQPVVQTTAPLFGPPAPWQVNVSERQVIAPDPGMPVEEVISRQTGETTTPGNDPAKFTTDPRIPRNVTAQLMQVARQMPDGPVEIRLNPEELGRVRMAMSVHDGAITVTLNVERAETADLMRRNLEMLTTEFRNLGFRDISFNFGGGQSKGSDKEDGQNSAQNGDFDQATVQETTGHRNIRSETRMDLRL